ncbi:hypothetical protein CK934_07020 [Chitinophaga sp. MD30]|nr:hypothetical protein CK934_07020 [Chitinophaga sp. MD30]
MGGLLAWLPLINSMELTDLGASRTTYQNLRTIAWNVIGWGGIGSFFTGLLNGMLTHWGLFRHRWIVLKLLLTIGMILFGMFYTERKMLVNLSLLDQGDPAILQDPLFLTNHHTLQLVVPMQLIVFFLIVLISVVKPPLR